jgi:O-antigen/teichoic acid export membrane protein
MAKPVIILYGGIKFLPAVNDFRMLSIAFWFLALSSIVAPYVIKVGAFGLSSLSAILLGIISIGLNFWFISSNGRQGAALATLFTCFIGFCGALYLLWFLSKKNPLVFLTLKVDHEKRFK